MLTHILIGLALWFLIEGLLYAAAPDAMKRFARYIAELPEAAIRQAGFLTMVLGIVFFWVVLRFSGAG
jgi:uncharacterized protein YjeT (DUF2065 family)